MARKDANPGQKEQAAVKAARALELRVAGKTFAQIGDALGVSDTTAFRYVRDRLDKLAEAVTAPDKRRWHALQVERCEAAIAAVWPAVRTGDPKAVGALDKLLRRQAALLGLDAPTHTVLSGDPDHPLTHKVYVADDDFDPDSA